MCKDTDNPKSNHKMTDLSKSNDLERVPTTVDKLQNDVAIDDLTQQLIIQLQIEDAEHFIDSVKGKGKALADDEISDSDLALELYKQELHASLSFITDRTMSKSIAMAVYTDGAVLEGRFAVEDAIVRDRALALSLSAQLDDNMQVIKKPFVPSEPQEMNDEIIRKLEGMYGYDTTAPRGIQKQIGYGTSGESSSWAASRTYERAKNTSQCVCCGDDKRFFEVARAPCNHEYCRDCLARLFSDSMIDESLFPPRCCKQPITLKTVKIFLKPALVREFEARKIELETTNRVYCHRPKCSAFIRKEHVTNDIATCQDCHSRTCAMCKAAAHNGDCPKDDALHQVLEVAQRFNWQRCYKCSRIVELQHGCNHITCLCKAQFCYICGQRWKSCACATWDEERLVARAHVIANRRNPDYRAPAIVPAAALPQPEAPPDPADAQAVVAHGYDFEENREAVVQASLRRVAAAEANRRAQLERYRQQIVENHDCEHVKWKWVGVPDRCEECNHWLPEYIFECRQCELRACNRCRRNRL